ncbi:hypothetical protein LCD52_14760 [Rossellomorea vietnamensis]|uniref:hypothetical protein n=1 Tax=Rossellomorea vietnamensis TaxID=218284 RepID=UPI001CCBC254|nr:hypothetical protein [Rossellomorea vietnamensis]MCA0150059.1 hypothetical protein [Rossellomorea vietnamensis]
MKYIHILILVVFIVFFSYTGSIGSAHPNGENSEVDVSDVTYVLSETKRDPMLAKAFSKAFDLKQGEDQIQYYYNHIDLNDDQQPETFVYLVGSPLCGSGGCSGALFTNQNGEYKLVTTFSLLRSPVIIENEKTNGWKNMIMYVSGGGIKGGYKRLRFDGKTYPSNPSVQPDVQKGKISGVGIINDDISKKEGIPF